MIMIYNNIKIINRVGILGKQYGLLLRGPTLMPISDALLNTKIWGSKYPN